MQCFLEPDEQILFDGFDLPEDLDEARRSLEVALSLLKVLVLEFTLRVIDIFVEADVLFGQEDTRFYGQVATPFQQLFYNDA